jgi:hypothetical protein
MALGSSSVRHCRLRLTFTEHVQKSQVYFQKRLGNSKIISYPILDFYPVICLVRDNQAQTWLIITINDTSIGDLPLIITISDTCKNQPKTLDFDNTINLSSLIVSLDDP